MKKIGLIVALLSCQFCVYSQNWQSMGTKKFNHEVDCIYSDTATGELYTTGLYWMIDTTAAYGLAEWNGNEWDTAFVNCGTGTQKRMCRFQGELYVTKSPYLFKWNGSSWDTAATAPGIFNLYNDGDSILYVLGSFTSVNSIPASMIAKFDGSNWSAIDATVWSGGAADCAFRYQGQMYFGGLFYNTTNNIWRIARWDGTNWNDVGGGITGSFGAAICMEEYNGQLYVGGYMELSAGNPGEYIARWDGATWTQVGGGIGGGQVLNLKSFNGYLWAVGQFLSAGGIPANFVARYDGLDWCSVGVFDNAIGSIEIHNGELLIGGNFWTVDGDSVNKVVKWIGGNFSDSCGHLNTGMNELAAFASVLVYPNPSSSITTFRFSGNPVPRTVVVTDELGREIWRKETSESTVEFPAMDFSDGLYFYTIIGSDLSPTSGKFIVQH